MEESAQSTRPTLPPVTVTNNRKLANGHTSDMCQVHQLLGVSSTKQDHEFGERQEILFSSLFLPGEGRKQGKIVDKFQTSKPAFCETIQNINNPVQVYPRSEVGQSRSPTGHRKFIVFREFFQRPIAIESHSNDPDRTFFFHR